MNDNYEQDCKMEGNLACINFYMTELDDAFDIDDLIDDMEDIEDVEGLGWVDGVFE